MAGQKREARLRARCPGHPRLSSGEAKTWMPRVKPGHDDLYLPLRQSSPPNQNYNSCHPRRKRIMVHKHWGLSRRFKGNRTIHACRQPAISRTKHVIWKNRCPKTERSTAPSTGQVIRLGVRAYNEEGNEDENGFVAGGGGGSGAGAARFCL